MIGSIEKPCARIYAPLHCKAWGGEGKLRNVSDSMHITDPGFEPRALTLPLNEVHLWRVYLDRVAAEEARWQRILSEEERARAKRFHFSQDRQKFSATRALLRTILGAYVGRNPETIVFRYSKKNKPFLESNSGASPLEFNVSHSGSRALLAFARGREVGVDVEVVRSNLDCESIARRFFSPAEQKELAAIEAPEKCRGFFRCWTRKEAYIKANGAGLSLLLDGFDVSLKVGEQNALLVTRPDGAESALWSLCEIEAGEEYEAALCVKGKGCVLKS
jgi:4'-phosphopantetheinyl transferase